jgi:hypothetical protein
MKLSQYLYVFNKVVATGDKRDEKFYLDGISAWHDFDGYTCYLSYKDMTLSLYFHGRFLFDYEDEQSLKQFNRLVKKYYPQASLH